MIHFITIRDTTTNKELTVFQPPTSKDFVIMETDGVPIETKTRSVGKVIRGWMKERKKEKPFSYLEETVKSIARTAEKASELREIVNRWEKECPTT